MNAKRITITGITGFVGQNLSKYLEEKEWDVLSLSLRNANWESFFDTKVQAVVHLAGKAHDLKKVSKPSDYYKVNDELTRQLFDSFLHSDAKVFVFISTVKAVADEVKGVLKETDEPNPKTHYGVSKLQAEQYIMSQSLPESKRVYVLRPCMIHGPGNKGNLNLLFNLVRKGFPWPLGAFENERSFCSIENLCFVIKELLDQDTILSGVYNVADDGSVSTNELIQLIAASQNKRAKILPFSKRLISGIAKTGDFFRLPLNSERLQKLTESYVVSNAKIKEAIGQPLPVNAQEGLLKTLRSFKKGK